MWNECEATSSKQSYVKRTNWSEFIGNSSKFSLHWHKFYWSKIWQRPLKLTETVSRKPALTKLYYMIYRKKTVSLSTLKKLSFLTDLINWHSQNQQLQYLSVYWHYLNSEYFFFFHNSLISDDFTSFLFKYLT